MKLLDKLLLRAKEMSGKWEGDVFIVVMLSPTRWQVKASMENTWDHETITYERIFSTLEEATDYCNELMDEYQTDGTIIINDAGGIEDGNSIENEDSNGSS